MQRNFLIIPVILAINLLGISHSHADLYRWKDEKGMTIYSDRVPPSESQKGHEVLSKDAISLHKIAPRKSEAQLALEREQAIKRAAETQRLEIRKQKDRALLVTFASVEQIDRLRDERLSLIDSNTKITQNKLDKIRLELEASKTKRDRLKKKKMEVPQQLSENIQSYYNRIVFYENQIDINERRKRGIIEKFAVDRARYIQLVSKN